ncbi:alpha/beta fold hydrolase [Geodermatophilus obscurus]|uniref:Alpha/beta hydrolase fold protein n=1 Tax=Geodermatophilus obscurus (strain ATCC 25078 / DSM 43160 / JCM 3152 / CCUG 61914 / KCC A-0152 / KCTC 9177 / NBRC 13315 / NRRL B-3577 / G-20) TaxID=526225 RepID=D2SF39_GEOOG|nr:alpha/beta hydrolase [Geodermatophilus obscurus]ADB74729.1 alpha/beta hydrolase fold protein [Geodermatophilus obscurus DSM 43160]
MTDPAPVTWTTAADGVRLAERRWTPEGAVRGTVQLVHGLSEHAGRYERLARALIAQGLAVGALDQRGHGRTAESTGPGGFGEGASSDAVLDDVRDLGQRLAADHPGVPAFLLGHSLGSAVALASAERDGAGLAGLVLSGPIGVSPGFVEVVPQLQAAVAGGMGDQPMDALGAFNAPFEPARTPFDWLTRDADEVDAYVADPLCGDDFPPTYRYGAGMFELVTQVATPEGVAGLPDGLPVLLLAGQRDPVGGVDAAQVTALADLLRAHGLPVELRVYPDARHEVFNETNRDEVTADLLAWMGARLAG